MNKLLKICLGVLDGIFYMVSFISVLLAAFIVWVTVLIFWASLLLEYAGDTTMLEIMDFLGYLTFGLGIALCYWTVDRIVKMYNSEVKKDEKKG